MAMHSTSVHPTGTSHSCKTPGHGRRSVTTMSDHSRADTGADQRRPIVVPPGGGRRYAMPGITAVFKADGDETGDGYTISTWRLDPHTTGPGAHSHPEDDVFFVTEGTMSFLVGDDWHDAPAGTLVLAPGGCTHDFENRSDEPATALNLGVPGGFEPAMPAIVDWFHANPPTHAG